MSYTKISKPTGTGYTVINPTGKQVFDDANTTYDSATAFYDGIESGVWTNITKPTGIAFIVKGMASGLMIPLTYSKEYTAGANLYTNVSKPT